VSWLHSPAAAFVFAALVLFVVVRAAARAVENEQDTDQRETDL
jgi:phosphate/sulfate permease